MVEEASKPILATISPLEAVDLQAVSSVAICRVDQVPYRVEAWAVLLQALSVVVHFPVAYSYCSSLLFLDKRRTSAPLGEGHLRP